MTISRADIDDAVAGYIEALLNSSYYGEEGTQISEDYGPGDIPKPALLSMRRDVEAFLRRNERLIRSASYRVSRGWPSRITEEPLVETIGWAGVGGDFATVRNGDTTTFDDLGWLPDELAERLGAAAWSFPKTELYVGDPERGRGEEPGRLYFYTERQR
jgi:hypothetical protein